MNNPAAGEHPFEQWLSVQEDELAFELRGHTALAWADFLLNPRRLWGSDFLMRWSQGVWSEERLTQAVNATSRYLAVPYGPSGTAPDNDVRAFELYFERLEAAGLGSMKRPDLLILSKKMLKMLNKLLVKSAVLKNFLSPKKMMSGCNVCLTKRLLPLNVKIVYGWRHKCLIMALH